MSMKQHIIYSFYIQRIISEPETMYHGYFQNINDFSDPYTAKFMFVAVGSNNDQQIRR